MRPALGRFLAHARGETTWATGTALAVAAPGVATGLGLPTALTWHCVLDRAGVVYRASGVLRRWVERGAVLSAVSSFAARQVAAAAPAGTKWVVGTELNLVQRLAQQFPEQRIAFLEKNVCYCSTMNRIDLPHLVWALESLVEGRVVNPIRVDEQVAADARRALDQMLALPGETSKD